MSEVGMSDQNETEEKPLSPLRAIRHHCLTCAGRPSEVRVCQSLECKLHRFRMGRNPARAGIGPGTVIKTDYGGKRNDSTTVSREIGGPEHIGTGAVENRALTKEIRLVEMKAVGKVQMIDRRIIIELSQD